MDISSRSNHFAHLHASYHHTAVGLAGVFVFVRTSSHATIRYFAANVQSFAPKQLHEEREATDREH